MCLVYVLLQARLLPGVMRETPRVHNYLQYIHWSVFGGAVRGVLQLSCLLLGLGGLQRDRKQGTLGFTLALPTSRPRLVITRAVMGFFQVLTLSILPPFILAATSPLVHQQLPLSYGLPFIPLWAIGGLFTFAVSFLCSVLFTSEYVALAVAYMSYMFYLAGVRHPRLAPYHLHVADLMSGDAPHQLDPHTTLWVGTYPIAPIFGFLAAAIFLLAIATFITTHQDL